MKTLLTSLLVTVLSGYQVYAQCPHDPTITPNDLILCPNSSDTLWTQSYDSYQWYKDGNIIPGATNQYLVVDDANDVLGNFTVEATDNNCAEMSPSVLVDGWAFLPGVVTNEGDYTFNPNPGVFEVCLGDTIRFIYSLTTNVQWTADNQPIPGATNATLELTSATVTNVVNYTVCGSPDVCPNYEICLGLNLPVQFIECNTNGIDELTHSFDVYPNPSEGLFTVESDGLLMESNYRIMDQLGRALLEGKIQSQKTVIDIREFPDGVYFIQFEREHPIKLLKD